MQISVRSHLTAGMAAVVGASAIAMAPVGAISAPSSLAVPVSASAEVALAGITLPFTDILSLLQTLGIGGTIPDITGLVPADFLNAIATEFLNQATPLVTTAASDLFVYLNSTVAALLSGPASIPARFGEALGAIPMVLTTAFQAASAGDIPAALQSLSTGLYAPITAVGQAVLEAGQAFQTYLTTQINSVTNALPGVLLAAVSKVITDNVQAVMATVQSAISGLLGGLIPTAASISVPAGMTAARVVAAAAASVSVTDSRRVDVVAKPEAASVDVDAVDAVDAVESSAPSVAVDIAESPAPPAAVDQTVAPAAPRSRAAAHRSAVTESVATESAASEPKHPSRARAARSAGGIAASERGIR